MSDADNSSFWSRLIHGIVLSWKHFPPIRLLDSTPISSVLSVYCIHTVDWPVTVLLACTIHTLKRKDGSDKIRLGSLPLFWCLFIKLSPVLVFLRADALCVPGFWVVPQTWSFHSKMLVKNSGLYSILSCLLIVSCEHLINQVIKYASGGLRESTLSGCLSESAR